jgi:predicted GH43/DUF377 family glycosyl hydrolase
MGNATALENGTALALTLKRSKTVLRPDASRVLLRQFEPGDARRIIGIIERIMAVPEAMVGPLLEQVSTDFAQRHLHLQQRFLDRFEQLRELVPAHAEFSTQRRLLIGAYFLAEYALESAALFSPSMVQHPDQMGLPEGAVRFILSLRATGEGHISSITFRSGIVHRDLRIEVDPAGNLLTEPRQIANTVYERPLFQRKLGELGLESDFTNRVLGRLGDSFGLTTLRDALSAELQHSGQAHGEAGEDQLRAQSIWMLARSNYEVQFEEEQDLSERIIFPSTPSQKNGIEDARFVRFRKDDGSYVYFATFTAYDGRVIMPELLETSDFLRFRFISLNGPEAENKGMALFPRKVNGAYAMISRQDNENIFLMRSDNVHFWNERQLLLKPKFPWELVQIGNCGSPIETEAGWLVLSHGVGPVRQYCIGAFLLDLKDPSKVLGRLREPMMTPEPSEREGYVPNVVYSCGALLHQGQLIIPYGLADHASGFATVALDDVLGAME